MSGLTVLAKKAMIYREQQLQKIPQSGADRCGRCGRPRGYIRRFNLCRICFRELALEGKLPGVVKSSW